MKKYFIIMVFFCIRLLVVAQQIAPVMKIKNENESIDNVMVLESLKIDIKVLGKIAFTTMDMTFYNNNKRVMEGEFNFPLGESQHISRFALDINGSLREGVVVEKEKARKTFEAVVRQGIDPGLLEKTEGNNFKARVYPFLAKGRRRVVIAFEQELLEKDKNDLYLLPLKIENELKEFNLKVEVLKNQVFIDNENEISNLSFSKWNESYVASIEKRNYTPNQQIALSFPHLKDDIKIFKAKNNSTPTYFYLQVNPKWIKKSKQMPSKVTVLWDNSHSANNRNLDRDIDLLEKYVKKTNNIEVELIPFNIETEKPQYFNIRNGNCSVLRSALKRIDYDAATSFECIDLKKYKSDEILIFSDGLYNFSSAHPVAQNAPVYTINSSSIANHPFLSYVAQKNGGLYINLNKLSNKEALEILSDIPYQFISAKVQNGNIREMYPSIPTPCKNNFTLAGIMESQKATVVLNFGFGKNIMYSKEIDITSQESENIDLLKRVWAEKKIDELSYLYEENKEEITHLGKTFGIVTPQTSLIVLDNLDDYLKYEIMPPADMQKEYMSKIQEKKKKKCEDEKNVIDKVVEMSNKQSNWWNTSYKEITKEKDTTIPNPNVNRNSPQPTNVNSHTTNTINNNVPTSQTTRVLSGIVSDDSGNPLPGVNILINGDISQAMQSDINGKYHIQIPENGRFLEFTLTGKIPQFINIDNSNEINVILLTSSTSNSHRENNRTLTGMVFGDDGASLPSATITVNGDNRRAAQTDIDGKYSIQLGENARFLRFSFVGMKTQYVVINNSNTINVTLSPDDSQLEGVVVTAYHIQTNEEIMASAISVNEKDDMNEESKITNGAIILNAWNSESPYLKVLQYAQKGDEYKTYLKLKKEYTSTPSFYIDAYDFFMKLKEEKIALKIISNLAELELENPQLLRVLSKKLLEHKQSKTALKLLEKLVEIRGEEPQSYRDLGLAYNETGQYQKAITSLYSVVKGSWDNRFNGIELIAMNEINNIIMRHNGLDTSFIDSRLIKKEPIDIRVVLSWDTDNCDMDLWVTDPDNEKCYYEHKLTISGGKISNDFTGGYGPEEYMIRSALMGKYNIKANYYGSNSSKILAPVNLHLEFYVNYGKPDQKKESVVIRLEKSKDTIDIGSFLFKK